MKLKKLSVCLALAGILPVHAEEITTLPAVDVTAERVQSLPETLELHQHDILKLRRQTNDTAKLLEGQPGVSLYGAGGVSSMPALHGMADDRVRVKVDGMDLISSCANHMNPPLSYIAPTEVGVVQVMAGLTPVSMGGDSIAGTIKVDGSKPEFAQAGEATLLKGQAGVFYRSNNQAQGGDISATIASENVSMRYSGSTVRAKNYKAGAVFKPGASIVGSLSNAYVAGDEVGSTAYQAENHKFAIAVRHEEQLLELKLGLQRIPYQGFPNQRMDMNGNDSQQINLSYSNVYAWGALEARAYNEHTRHSMQFLNDKTYWYGALLNVPGMPMNTDGKNTGFSVKADMPLNDRDLLRVGAEIQRYRLNDWWNPSANSPMMTPNTFWNINNGQRDRGDIYAEWEASWSPAWMSLLGVRSGTVKSDAGVVQGYSPMMYGVAANAFNAQNHQRSDNNVDVTASSRYTPDANKSFEAGYAMKTRSPNLYERYTWANSNTMVMNMNNWYGDGNGYVGNPNLVPEIAHTLSATASLHDEGKKAWEVKVTPYYTRVNNYIDAVACPTCPARVDGFLNLTLANQSARLYGADMSGNKTLFETRSYGEFTLKSVLNYTKGKNLTTGDNLYNIMPLNAKLSLEQRLGGWTNTVGVTLVDRKSNVQAVRKELPTGGYSLVDLISSYEWKQIRLDMGVENLFNRYYALPLGGAYLGQGATMGTGVVYGKVVPGMGRSINMAVSVKF